VLTNDAGNVSNEEFESTCQFAQPDMDNLGELRFNQFVIKLLLFVKLLLCNNRKLK